MGPGLGAEPLNAWSNLAFLVAAWACWRLAHRSGPVSGSMSALIFLMAAIGAGSALFHVFATTWSGVLDLVPILVFQLGYLWRYCRRIVLLPSSYSVLAVAGLFLASLICWALPQASQRPLTFIPSLILLLGLGIYHYFNQNFNQNFNQRKQPLTLIAAAGVFALALAFRNTDGAVCPLFAIGTHFLWHILGAATLYLLFRGLAADRRT